MAEWLTGGTIVLVVLLVLAAVTAMKGIRTVPQGEVWTVERFGAFTRLLQPGLNFVVPYVDSIGRKLNVQEIVLDIPEQVVITQDNASVTADGIVYYRIMDPRRAAYEVQDLEGALTALAREAKAQGIGLTVDAEEAERLEISLDILDSGFEHVQGVSQLIQLRPRHHELRLAESQFRGTSLRLVFPLPAGPHIIIRPRGFSDKVFNTGGNESDSKLRSTVAIKRATNAICP